MRLAVLSLCLLCAPAVVAQAPPSANQTESARQVLEDCAASLDSEILGTENIEAECPGITQALDDLGLTTFLPEWQQASIGRDGLQHLVEVERRYREEPASRDVSTTSLQSVLDTLKKEPRVQEKLSWFERLQRWLRERTKKRGDSDSWLDRWFNKQHLSDEARRYLIYGVLGLIVLLALAVVINEIRIARRGRRKGSPKEATDTVVTNVEKVLGLDAATRTDRPSVMLRTLVATLVKTGRLQTERSLTHSELTLRAKFDDQVQRESFQRVAQLAERVVYGGENVATSDLDEVVQVGQTLNAQLRGAAP